MAKKSDAYLGNPNLKKSGIQVEWTPEMIEEWEKCYNDPVYFTEKYVRIIHVDRGVIPFIPYDYQKEIIDTIHEERFTIILASRQVGKTTALVSSILHYVLFNDDKTVALLANKGDTAREILNRIQIAYELLPKWMQQGIVEYNKGSMELENKSRIIAGSTSSSSIRGFSISFLYIDECVSGDTLITIKHNSIETQIKISEIFNPMLRSEIQYFDDMQVLTVNGFRGFDGIKRSYAKTIKIEFDNGSDLVCTLNHRIKTKDGFIEAKDLNVGDYVFEFKIIKIQEDKQQYVYDLLNVKDGNEYITNNVISHNCAFVEDWDEFYTSVYPTISSGKETKVVFTSTPNSLNHYYKLWSDAIDGKSSFIPIKVTWESLPGRDEKWKAETIANTSMEAFIQEHEAEFIGSSGTLIDGWKLKELKEWQPITKNQFSSVYELPQKEAEYILVADVSRGKGIDNSAFSIIKTSGLPYKVVATYYCSNIPPDMYAEVIYQAHKYYNDAYVVVENNDAGCECLRVLYDTYECETILGMQSNNMYGDKRRLSVGGGMHFELGIKTTKNVKAIGCARLKTLLENNTLDFGDKNIIDEINRFSRKGNTYQAEVGAHDDIVMTLVIFSWLTTQDIFVGLTNIEVRENIRENFEERFEEELAPFGYMINGLDDNLTFNDISMQRELLGRTTSLPDYTDYHKLMGNSIEDITVFPMATLRDDK